MGKFLVQQKGRGLYNPQVRLKGVRGLSTGHNGTVMIRNKMTLCVSFTMEATEERKKQIGAFLLPSQLLSKINKT